MIKNLRPGISLTLLTIGLSILGGCEKKAVILTKTGSSETLAINTPYITEIIVRTVENFKTHNDVVNFFNIAVNRHVSIVNLNVKEDEDDAVPSGYVFYKSTIAPIASGYRNFDALQEVITEAHKRNIQVRAWIPQFHDKGAVEKNSAWQMKSLVNGMVVPFMGSNGIEYFVNPVHPGVQAYERSIIKEVVTKYDIDGLVLDWLRFDDYNMDMGSYTRQKYKALFGYDPITINFTTNNAKRTQWNNWRTDQIGTYVQNVRNDINAIVPGLFLGVYILPPEFVEVGQDAAKFKNYVDFVSPMSYFADWGFQPDWIYNNTGITAQTKVKVGSKEIISVFDISWTDNQYHEIYSGLRANYPEINNLSYFGYGKWTDNDLKKIDTRR